MKKRLGDPWIPAAAYGQLLPQFTVNLIVRDIPRSLRFYEEVLLAHVHYADPDFAAIRILATELMLHADHTYEANPWFSSLDQGDRRGLGAELRLLGMNPDELARRAMKIDAVVREVTERGHG